MTVSMHQAIIENGFYSQNRERPEALGELNNGDLLRQFYIGTDGVIYENSLSDEIIVESVDGDTVHLINVYYHKRNKNNPACNVFSTTTLEKLFAEYTK